MAFTWHDVSALGYNSPWVDYPDSNYSPAKYTKDKSGYVYMQGLVVGTGASMGSTIFTLPFGFRPESTFILPFLCLSWNGSAYVMARIDVSGGVVGDLAPGAVVYQAGGLDWISLAGIRFLVEQ